MPTNAPKTHAHDHGDTARCGRSAVMMEPHPTCLKCRREILRDTHEPAHRRKSLGQSWGGRPLIGWDTGCTCGWTRTSNENYLAAELDYGMHLRALLDPEDQRLNAYRLVICSGTTGRLHPRIDGAAATCLDCASAYFGQCDHHRARGGLG